MATDPQTIEAYNKNAQAYNEHVLNPDDSIYHAYYEKPAIRAELPDLSGKQVISIGCGSGVDAQWLLEHGAQSVAGIDISKELIAIARQNYPDVDLRVMDMEALDFPDASFDVAYSSLAIHYVDDWTQPLREAHRILRPGGTYVFSCGHPLDTAQERQRKDDHKTSLLGKIVHDDGTREVVGDYLVADQTPAGIKPYDGVLGGFSVRVYHRPISEMIKEIRTAGFIIEKMVEPLPVPAMEKANPAIYKQLMKLPEFMVWVLVKEA